ncbi:MAG: lipid-A-disaccharide synthase N-terminal domain-containing protein [Candidatus Puniceispirillaceae bacterium]
MLETISGIIGGGALFAGQFLLGLFPFLPASLATKPEQLMIIIGFAGQGLFAMRFIIQWLKSEGEGRSVIPLAFWYFSIGGGVVLFLYALWRQDPVIICGQGLGLFIYLRNLFLIFKERNSDKA